MGSSRLRRGGLSIYNSLLPPKTWRETKVHVDGQRRGEETAKLLVSSRHLPSVFLMRLAFS